MDQNSDTNTTETNTHARTIEFDSPEILALVEKKMELVKEGRAMNDEALALAEQHQKLVEGIATRADEIRNIQLDIIPLVKDICIKEELLSEYEVPMTTDIENGKLVLKVEDQMAMFTTKFNSVDKFGEVAEVKDTKEQIKE